ncbi:hypothetical protein [Bacillus sp. ISL-46]|uniref:hypothetical protein n=1 Tax=Bacillus sp. ISL-46 TaxID=2819129 RepID=UPI001BEA740C|nr:hypothetical protein [Bacillus sp. ISL-46]MBT2721458.1 hypothetical protein [Bacillus sp. ISL-46]
MPSPTKREIIKKYRSLLTKLNSDKKMVGILRRKKIDSAYEVYIFSLILKAVKNISDDNKIKFRGIKSDPTKKIIFRGSPGKIHSTRYNYGYAEFTYLEKTYEVHLDILYTGTSKVQHEIDISIIDKESANNARNKLENPNTRGLRVAFECKFYDKLEIHLIRTFIGLLDDMGQVNFACFLSNNKSDSIKQYCTGKKNRPFFFPLVTPLEPDFEIKFVNFIEVYIQKAFGRA